MSGMSGEAGSETVGDIAIVLHSHMPYVEGFGTYPFGEEWLFDAFVRSHVPVLEAARDLTVTVTPVLADQLEDRGVGERLLRFVRKYRVGSAELDAGDVEPDLVDACVAEAGRYRDALATLERHNGNPLDVFAGAADSGRVELVTSAATHAVLPLIATRAGRLLQIETGLRSHRRRFGRSRGIWLPECAYEPGLEHLLAELGVEYFCTDQSAHEPASAALRPIATAGPTAFPIDWEAVQWLWSWGGYPSDPAYADFHAKSLRGCRPWSIAGEPYEPEAAAERAREQARSFARDVASRLSGYRADAGRRGLLTFAIDTELLGHWWWEGPTWLEQVLIELPAAGVRPITLSRARDEHEAEARPLAASTWGEGKDRRTWDSPPVADLTWAVRRLELRALREASGGRLRGPALLRVARELLAAQASDWAFLDYGRQTGDYPYQRLLDHSRALFEAIECGESAESTMRNLAPDLNPAPLLEP
jgi:1,4-alpha-glucan branching enzyme